MATKLHCLVVATLAITALAVNDSEDRKSNSTLITIDPLTAKDVANYFSEALQEEEPLLQEEDKSVDPPHQKSLLRTHLRSSASKKSQPSHHVDSSRPTTRSIDHISKHIEQAQWSSDFEKDVTDLVLGLSSGGFAATPFGDSVSKILDLITDPETGMMFKVKNASDTQQAQLDAYKGLIGACETARVTGVNGTHTVNHKTWYLANSTLHKSCRLEEESDLTNKDHCHTTWSTMYDDKDLKCKAYLEAESKYGEQNTNQDIVKRAPSEAVESYLRRITETICGTQLNCSACSATGSHYTGGWHGMLVDLEAHETLCNTATTDLNSKSSECKELDHTYYNQRNNCDALQDQMDKAACDWATLTNSACEAYDICYSRDRSAYDVEAASAVNMEKDRKAEWIGLERMKCLIDAFATPADAPMVTQDEINYCRFNLTHDTSHLDLVYPHETASNSETVDTSLHATEIPSRVACDVDKRYPNTAEYKLAEFTVLPATAKGKADAYSCPGMTEVSTEPAEGSPDTCACDKVLITGPFAPGALVRCHNCLDVYRSNEKNSCPVGTKLFSPRSHEDWESLLAIAAPLDPDLGVSNPNWIVDVTRGDDGMPGPVINSETASTGHDEARMKTKWMTTDGSPWWLSAASYDVVPESTYQANCYLNLDLEIDPATSLATGVTVANHGCEYHSRSYYCQPVTQSLLPTAGSPTACVCKRVSLVGTYSAGILIKCEKCKDVFKSLDTNSCPTGTKLFSPRSRTDWKTVLDSVPPLRSPHWIIDVTRPQDDCGGCKDAAMNSDMPEQATWITKDGSPWWLRSTTTTEGPTSQYIANCYMNVYAFGNENAVQFDTPRIMTEAEATAGEEFGSIVANKCSFHSDSYYCQSVRTTTTTTTPRCTVPEIDSVAIEGWTGVNCASGSDNVQAGTDCQIIPRSGYTCTSPGICNENGGFQETASCETTCTVPDIDIAMVESWSGTNCASGAGNVKTGTECTLTARSGFSCSSPGMCTIDGTFEHEGFCKALEAASYDEGAVGKYQGEQTVADLDATTGTEDTPEDTADA